MKKESLLFGIISIVLLLGIITVYVLQNRKEEGYDFQIYFFNAGKADAILLSNNGKYIMIDTGEESLSDEILSYFQQNNITKLEYLIITHFDKDHVGSASSIIDNIEVETVLQSDALKESEYYTNYINSLAKKEMTPITVKGNYEIDWNGILITVNGPEKIYESNESNNSSLIVSITHEENKFLFMGDSQNARIKDFLEMNTKTYQFLKVPYHGNYLKRLESLLESKNIEYAVITSSDKEKEAEETIALLEKYNVSYYLTREGSIRVLSNGKDIQIKQ